MAKTILIVEDNALNMKLMRDLLGAAGFDTLLADNGTTAFELAKAEKPDLVLMDIQLPDVSGLDVTRWLKADEALKSIPIIAVTALAFRGDEERVIEAGCDANISKPISVDEFLERVKDFVG